MNPTEQVLTAVKNTLKHYDSSNMWDAKAVELLVLLANYLALEIARAQVLQEARELAEDKLAAEFTDPNL